MSREPMWMSPLLPACSCRRFPASVRCSAGRLVSGSRQPPTHSSSDLKAPQSPDGSRSHRSPRSGSPRRTSTCLIHTSQQVVMSPLEGRECRISSPFEAPNSLPWRIQSPRSESQQFLIVKACFPPIQAHRRPPPSRRRSTHR